MTRPSLPYGVEPPGFRLPAGAHLGRVRLRISDLERSIEYYRTVIGLRVLERRDGMAALGPHGDGRVLVELHEQRGVHPVARRGQIGLYHFAILLPDRAALGRFVQHLADIGARAGMSDHLVSEAVYVYDPDGLGIEVYADRPRESWTHVDRQITMATEPMNVRDVIAAAKGERWTGAPAGTVIGHVHLYVRDIEVAAAFYHDALGFDKVVWNYPGALFLSAGGYHHHLGTNTWAADAAVPTENDARLIEWELVLPDVPSVAEAAGSLAQSGAPITWHGDQVTVGDPWGTQLRLVSE